MKKSVRNAGFVILFGTLFFSISSCSKDDSPANNANNNGNINIANLQAQINSLPKEPLNQTELTSLSFMREEEKLARDVYITLYNKWGVNIFTNISNSEQAHMEAILMLLNQYSLTDKKHLQWTFSRKSARCLKLDLKIHLSIPSQI